MIDFGFDKIALIGAVALIVIGPEKLPRVARTVERIPPPAACNSS